MRIRHDRVHESGLDATDAMFVHLVCDHGYHPHAVDHLDLAEMRECHADDHAAHELDGQLRRSVTQFLEIWRSGDTLRIRNSADRLERLVRIGLRNRRHDVVDERRDAPLRSI